MRIMLLQKGLYFINTYYTTSQGKSAFLRIFWQHKSQAFNDTAKHCNLDNNVSVFGSPITFLKNATWTIV